MRRAALALAVLLAACAEEAPPPAAPGAGSAPAGDAAALPEPAPSAAAPARTARLRRPDDAAPHIYMDLAPAPDGTVTVIFAIDASRDATPGDDPAVRITPAGGACNPERTGPHAFAADARPVFGPDQLAEGVEADLLAPFMAVQVTERMLAEGLAARREDTTPQNICARKFWEYQRWAARTARSGQ